MQGVTSDIPPSPPQTNSFIWGGEGATEHSSIGHHARVCLRGFRNLQQWLPIFAACGITQGSLGIMRSAPTPAHSDFTGMGCDLSTGSLKSSPGDLTLQRSLQTDHCLPPLPEDAILAKATL